MQKYFLLFFTLFLSFLGKSQNYSASLEAKISPLNVFRLGVGGSLEFGFKKYYSFESDIAGFRGVLSKNKIIESQQLFKTYLFLMDKKVHTGFYIGMRYSQKKGHLAVVSPPYNGKWFTPDYTLGRKNSIGFIVGVKIPTKNRITFDFNCGIGYAIKSTVELLYKEEIIGQFRLGFRLSDK